MRPAVYPTVTFDHGKKDRRTRRGRAHSSTRNEKLAERAKNGLVFLTLNGLSEPEDEQKALALFPAAAEEVPALREAVPRAASHRSF